METFGNVIVLERARKSFYDAVFNEKEEIVLPRSEKVELIEKAHKLLNDMEETWEMDHTVAELRDKFHLLRYYLERLNTSVMAEDI